jgi:diadenosine tetraphosphatase ApaH/serine/threonine PP2A family protein phosphatase
MPLAAIVDDRFFCVHGGISPELHTIKDIDKVPSEVLLNRISDGCSS